MKNRKQALRMKSCIYIQKYSSKLILALSLCLIPTLIGPMNE